MKKMKTIAIIGLTITIHQAIAMDSSCCSCLETLFGYSYNQKKLEYIESLKKVEALDRQSINTMLNQLTYEQLEHIRQFIENNEMEAMFPRLHPLVSNVAYYKDLQGTIKNLSTPSHLVMRPITRDNIRNGFHPGILLME